MVYFYPYNSDFIDTVYCIVFARHDEWLNKGFIDESWPLINQQLIMRPQVELLIAIINDPNRVDKHYLTSRVPSN